MKLLQRSMTSMHGCVYGICSDGKTFKFFVQENRLLFYTFVFSLYYFSKKPAIQGDFYVLKQGYTFFAQLFELEK